MLRCSWSLCLSWKCRGQVRYFQPAFLSRGWLCVHVSLHAISLFCLFPYSFPIFFIQSQANMVQREGVSQRIKFQQVSWKFCVVVQKKRTTNCSQKESQLKAAWVLIHRSNKWSAEGWGGDKRRPKRPSHRKASLDIASYPKMHITGSQALVLTLSLRAVLWTAACFWKFLLPKLTLTHWNMFFISFFFGGRNGV